MPSQPRALKALGLRDIRLLSESTLIKWRSSSSDRGFVSSNGFPAARAPANIPALTFERRKTSWATCSPLCNSGDLS